MSGVWNNVDGCLFGMSQLGKKDEIWKKYWLRIASADDGKKWDVNCILLKVIGTKIQKQLTSFFV